MLTYLLISILIFEIVLFYVFYNHYSGRKAVYSAWYAWIIDTLAIFSGISIMFLAYYSLYNPKIFTIQIPKSLFILVFIFGSWQFGIHFVKLIIRQTIKIHKRSKKHKMDYNDTKMINKILDKLEKRYDERFDQSENKIY